MQRNSITFAQVQQAARAAGLPIARHEGDGIYFVPSATVAGVVYTVVLGTALPVCSCPAPVGTCWHGARAQEIAGQDAATARQAQIAARYAQAMDDLFERRAVA